MLFKAASLALLLGAAAAQAQIVDVRDSTVGTVVIHPGPGSGMFVDSPTARVYRSNLGGFGAGFAAFTDINETSIYFENGAMSAGAFNSARAVTEVVIDFVNGGSKPTLSGIESVIFESGFGFYIGEFSNVSGCSGATLPDCARSSVGPGFSNFVVAAGATRDGLAGVSFSFEVLYDGALVRRIGGSMLMLKLGDAISIIEDFGVGADNLFTVLTDFGLDAPSSDYAHVYRWDTTPFFVGFDTLLPPGGAASVTYRIITESWSQAAYPAGDRGGNMLIGFACVRDPVGRGGGFEDARAMAVAMAASIADNICIDDLPAFGGNVLGLPTVKDGVIVFRPLGDDPPVIPEPASWALMIAGFGLVGAAARRRRGSFGCA